MSSLDRRSFLHLIGAVPLATFIPVAGAHQAPSNESLPAPCGCPVCGRVIAAADSMGTRELARRAEISLEDLRDAYHGFGCLDGRRLGRVVCAIADVDDTDPTDVMMQVLGLGEWEHDQTWRATIAHTQQGAARLLQLADDVPLSPRDLCAAAGVELGDLRDWWSGFDSPRCGIAASLIEVVRTTDQDAYGFVVGTSPRQYPKEGPSACSWA